MKKRSAFTLVEIMFAIVIAGVLATQALPKYALSIKKSAEKQCMATRRNIQTAEDRYVFEHENQQSSGFNVLVSQNYLDRMPKCYAGGYYVWSSTASDRIIICSLHGSAQLSSGSGSGPLFSSNFDAMDYLTIGAGKWVISNGTLVPTFNGENRIYFGDTAWKDYTVATKVTLSAGNGYGVYYRADGKANVTGYAFQYDPGLGNKFVVRKVVNGSETAPIATVNMPSGFAIYGKEHDIAVTLQGSRQIISIDGVNVLDFNDSSFTSGNAGFRSWYGSQVSFNSATVTK